MVLVITGIIMRTSATYQGFCVCSMHGISLTVQTCDQSSVSFFLSLKLIKYFRMFKTWCTVWYTTWMNCKKRQTDTIDIKK